MTAIPENPEPERWQFEVPSNTLTEIKAMAVIVGLMENLDDDEVGRVLGWAVDRYRVDNGSTPEATQ